MRASVISTVLNEEKSIEKFIDSIVNQSVIPDEFIIVDAGSKDKTIDLINKNIKKYKSKLLIKLIHKSGNRSIGRNEAIKNSSNELIAVTDAGCMPEKDWFKNITSPFKDKSIDVVSGYYKPRYRNIFEKSLSTYTSVMPDKINEEEFVPSSRSVAFKKSAWKKSGGYPENLDTCEDLVFAKRLRNSKNKFIFKKNASVDWPQRKNLKEAFFQFFSYAKGDGVARYFRKNTPFLYFRYILATYLFALAFILNSILFNLLLLVFLFSYIIWAIKKNYKYVNNKKAYYYLPLLQFTSDVAVLLGTTLGFIQGINIKNILKWFRSNKFLSIGIAGYILLMLYLIEWGIPNLNHPFNYAMDEWHFSQALRTFIKYGSGSISGAASIPLYHIVSSIVFVLPFYVLQIVNPLAIKNTLDNIPMQHTLFIILRLHTLMYGLLSLGVVYKIFKKYIKLFPQIFTLLFIFNPILLSLTNYYKYDLTLISWILLSIYLLFKYLNKQELSFYLFASIAFALSLSTKFTAVPFIIPLAASYFIFSKKINIKHFIYCILISLFVFAFVGIPDLIFGKGNYYELLYSTLIQGPTRSLGFNLGMSASYFLLFKEFPSIFGYLLTYIFYISFIFWTFKLIKGLINKSLSNYKVESFVYLGTLSFLIPSLVFNVDGGGNRALVLLPFIVLLSGLFIRNIYLSINKKYKIFFVSLLMLILLFQLIQSFSWLSVKFYNDPRQTSSTWILKNIPANSTFGIENIPIYQMLPDVILKEFYSKEQNPKIENKYKYKVITTSDNLPKYVILTNDFRNLKYVSKSPKKDLFNELGKQKYKLIYRTGPELKYYNLFSDEIYFIVANIIPMPVTVSIYEK
jgi:glycosyltransferase involved in cell wall biosynthesis